VKALVDGWRSVLNGKVNVGREYYTKGWDPAVAQTETDQAITALGKANIIGVFAMNDGMAGGAIAALKGAGFKPLPPVTGMDSEIAAVQRILIGEQAGSVFNSPIKMATAVAKVVGQLANNQTLSPDSTVDNVTGNHVKIFYTPTPVTTTKATIKQYLIDPGVYSVNDICTAAFTDACKAAGLL
jgi:D-xylose transport system substrate-binding protein